MEKILVSACLLGAKTRYDGKSKPVSLVASLLENYEIIPLCPEVDGGLPIPRAPAEIQGDKIINSQGVDVTENYLAGANLGLALAKKNHIAFAILKENSPACGLTHIYDGTFSHNLIEGEGILTKILRKNGYKVYNEQQVQAIKEMLDKN